MTLKHRKMATMAIVIILLVCLTVYTTGQCDFNCNAPLGGRCNTARNQCVCNKGYSGLFCTCDPRCSGDYGSCKNDICGTCLCNTGWKGRNCLCPSSCPETDNWVCRPDTTCGCQPGTYDATKCCPNSCDPALSLVCPTNDGVCKCTKDNKLIPWGSSPSTYTCCDDFCKPPTMECTLQGCACKITGTIVTAKEQCRHNLPVTCYNIGSESECAAYPGQGACDVDNTCKCWYGWAGGQGVYGYDGFLRAQHCRTACMWTHHYKPATCLSVS